jgi:hypothetical protein
VCRPVLLHGRSCFKGPRLLMRQGSNRCSFIVRLIRPARGGLKLQNPGDSFFGSRGKRILRLPPFSFPSRSLRPLGEPLHLGSPPLRSSSIGKIVSANPRRAPRTRTRLFPGGAFLPSSHHPESFSQSPGNRFGYPNFLCFLWVRRNFCQDLIRVFL